MQTWHREVAGWLQSTTRVDRATGPVMQRARTLQQDSVNHVVVTFVGLQGNGGRGGGRVLHLEEDRPCNGVFCRQSR